jgi:hypothetical protein
MSNEEINKRNEAIALFEGFEFHNDDQAFYPNGYFMLEDEDQKIISELKDLEYNTSWDWLMPVVEKISKMTYEDGDQIYPRTFAMSHENGSSYLFRLNRCGLVESESFIESVFIGVSDFCLNQVK